MQLLTVRKALEIAVNAEDLGVNFYSELARRFSSNKELKETFELLAKDEIAHKKYFIDLLNNLSEDLHGNEIDEQFLAGVDISRHFNNLQDVNAELKIEEILKRVYNFEKESVLFYVGIREIFKTNSVLDEIIKVEKEHMVKVFKYITTDSKFRGLTDTW